MGLTATKFGPYTFLICERTKHDLNRARWKSSNSEGLDAIFRAHYERIARVIGRVIHDQARAEELAVDVFLKWWRNPRAHGEHAEGWLYRTAVREALDELRRQTRRSRFERLFSFFRESPQTPEHLYAVNAEQHESANRSRSFKSTPCRATAPVEPRPQLPGDCRLSPRESQLCRKSCQPCSRSVPEGVLETIWKPIMKTQWIADRLATRRNTLESESCARGANCSHAPSW